MRIPPYRRLLPAAAAVAAGIALAGCGSSSSSGSGGGTTTAATTTEQTGSTTGSAGAQDLTLTADAGGALAFNTKTLSAKPGAVTITLTNPSSISHAIAIEGNGVDKDGSVVSTGGKSTVTATLKAGTYTFYCPVPGHRAAGMEGTLTVK